MLNLDEMVKKHIDTMQKMAVQFRYTRSKHYMYKYCITEDGMVQVATYKGSVLLDVHWRDREQSRRIEIPQSCETELTGEEFDRLMLLESLGG